MALWFYKGFLHKVILHLGKLRKGVGTTARSARVKDLFQVTDPASGRGTFCILG